MKKKTSLFTLLLLSAGLGLSACNGGGASQESSQQSQATSSGPSSSQSSSATSSKGSTGSSTQSSSSSSTQSSQPSPAKEAFKKLNNLSDLSVNIQNATSLGLAKGNKSSIKARRKAANAGEEFKPTNTMVMTSTDYDPNDPSFNEDGTMDVSFTKIDTTVTTKDVSGDKKLIASPKEGDTDEVVVTEYGASTITFESDAKHEYRVVDGEGNVVQDWFKGQANSTTTERIDGTYVDFEYTPVHAGTLQDPYSVTDVFELASELADNGRDNKTVYVKGTVSSQLADIKYNYEYKSATFDITDGVHTIRAYSINGCSLEPGEGGYIGTGYEVVVTGVVMKYMDNGVAVPEVGYNKNLKNNPTLVSSTKPQEQGGGSSSFTPTHAGTLLDPYSVSDAFGLIGDLADGAHTTEDIYVKGTISSATADIYINEDYHSGTFFITDGEKTIKAYSINGCTKQSGQEGFIDSAYEVVVKGVLIKYMDNGVAVPEVGYNNQVKNQTQLVSATAPANHLSSALPASAPTATAKTKQFTVEARSIDAIVSYPNHAGFRYTLTDDQGNVVVPETTSAGTANISTDDSLVVFGGLVEGKEYTLHYAGKGEETTVEQTTVGGEIDKMYVYNERFTFVSFVPYGTGSRPENLKYESDGIANYDRRDYYSDANRQSFIFDNNSGFIYLIQNFHIKYIHNNLLLSDKDNFVYDFKVDDENNLVIFALFTSTSLECFNFFKDKNGVNVIQNDKANLYDAETDTYFFVAPNNRDDLTKIKTCGEYETYEAFAKYVKTLGPTDPKWETLNAIDAHWNDNFRDDKNERYYLTTTNEIVFVDYISDVYKSINEYHMVLPGHETRELTIADQFSTVTHYSWWGDFLHVSKGVIYGLRNFDSYQPYLQCQGGLWFYDFANNEDIYWCDLPGFMERCTTFINWNYIDRYDTMLIYLGEASTLYSWTLDDLAKFTATTTPVWVSNDLVINVQKIDLFELSDVVLENCSLSDDYDAILTYGIHGDISYEVVVEEDDAGNARVKAYKSDEYVAPEIKIILQPINR